MENFRAGIGPSSINDVLEIKIIICYLLKFFEEPLSKPQIFDVLAFNNLVNYFYFSQAFEELMQGEELILLGEEVKLSKSGRELVDLLQDKVSHNVRDMLEFSAKNYTQKLIFEKWHSIDVKKEKTGYTIRCEIRDEETKLLNVSLFVPEKATLNSIKKRFFEYPEEIYKQIVRSLTGESLE